MRASTIRTILVSVRGVRAEEAPLRQAVALVRALDGHLQVLHAQPRPQEAVVTSRGADYQLSGGAWLLEGLGETAAERDAVARHQFETICAEPKLRAAGGRAGAEWIAVPGIEAECVAQFGRTADLVLVHRPVDPDLGSLEVLQAALFQTGRPILILPSGAHVRPGGTLILAWKDKPEAARAVTAAMPFILSAERLVVVSVEEGESGEDGSAERIVQTLGRHNAATSLVRLPTDGRSAEDLLLEEAANQDASMLLMGGYGHSRTREAVFGGVTRSVINRASIPVLMMH